MGTPSTAIVHVVAIRDTSVAKVPEYRQSDEQQMLNRRIFANSRQHSRSTSAFPRLGR
jgi:hypothetical protein